DRNVTGVQTCALPILNEGGGAATEVLHRQEGPRSGRRGCRPYRSVPRDALRVGRVGSRRAGRSLAVPPLGRRASPRGPLLPCPTIGSASCRQGVSDTS